MRILSLFYGHDANCTLMEDGEPVVGVVESDPLDAAHERLDVGVCDGHEGIIPRMPVVPTRIGTSV